MSKSFLSVKFGEDYTVVQANELVRSKQEDLTLLEAKLVRLAISQVLENDKNLKTYTCSVSELANFLRIKSENIYRDIKKISLDLMKKTIYIKDPASESDKPNYKIFHWVDCIEYNDGNITFRLSESLKPYLLGLEKLFTVYGYGDLLNLPTNYSIRLYELLSSWSNSTILDVVAEKPNYTKIPLGKNEFIFTVEYLKKYFNCLEKYPNNGNFIIRVIDSAVKAIQKNTVMNVSYRKVKEGREIKYIVFKLNDWSE